MGCRKMERKYVIPTITRKIQVINNTTKVPLIFVSLPKQATGQ